jgi:hypothetical protein
MAAHLPDASVTDPAQTKGETMSEHRQAWQRGEDVQVLENALRDSELPADTRSAMHKRASLSLLGPGPHGGAARGLRLELKEGQLDLQAGHDLHHHLERQRRRDPDDHQRRRDRRGARGNRLSAVIEKSPGTPVAKFADLLKAANAEEYDHYKALQTLGAKPLRTKFWAPTAFFAAVLERGGERPVWLVMAHGVLDHVVDHSCQQRFAAHDADRGEARAQANMFGGDRLAAPGEGVIRELRERYRRGVEFGMLGAG